MTLAPWRSQISGALHRNRSLPYARYMQLATVREDGRPGNRTVVFRGFLEGTNQLQMITDRRSAKINHINHLAWGEIAWYFPNTREQFRLLGRLRLVQEGDPDEFLNKARSRLWHDISDAARLQFAWPHPAHPRSAPLTASPPSFDSTHGNPTPHSPLPTPLSPHTPLPTFCLLLLDPTEVDRLQLKGDPQSRDRYLQGEDGNWTVTALNP